MLPPRLTGLLIVFLPMTVIVGATLSGFSQLTACTMSLVVFVGGGALFLFRHRATSFREARAYQPAPLEDFGARAEQTFRPDDPQFSAQGLVDEVNALCAKLSAGADLDAVHPFISDGLYQRLKTLARLGARPLSALVTQPISSSVVSAASVTARWQHVTVRLTLGAAVDAQTWSITLLRRRGTKTSSQRAVGACPHCGAPLELSATQRCRHCEAVVNSGTHGWVVCEVVSGAHQLGLQSDVLDPDAVRARDPELSAEELEDRAALTFWRWIEARTLGATARLARVATAAFLADRDETEVPRGDVSLGRVELRALHATEAGDEAHVSLRWSVAEGGATRAHQTVFKLLRPRGTSTEPRLGLATLRCTHCLAAVTDAETPACEFCGASLRDTWCLHGFEPFAAWSARAITLRKQLGSDWIRSSTEAQREGALRLLASLAHVDGLSENERAQLRELGEKWLLPDTLVASCLETKRATAPSLSRELALSLTQELASLAMSDGKISPATRKRLEAMATTLGTQAELTRSLAKLVATSHQ